MGSGRGKRVRTEQNVDELRYAHEQTATAAASTTDITAVNAAARAYLGIDSYDMSQAGVESGEGVIRYFADANSILVYGYSAEDTKAAVEALNAGGLTGDEERVN